MRRIVAAAAIAIAFASAPTAQATDGGPTCDQSDVTLCHWTVEVDGPSGTLIDIEVKGCAYEDGNPDGLPCLWFDPDTARPFLVDGSNYR